MKQESFMEKVKTICRKIGKRNFIIFGAVVLIATAVVVNVAIFAKDDGDGSDSNQSAGMAPPYAPFPTNITIQDTATAPSLANILTVKQR